MEVVFFPITFKNINYIHYYVNKYKRYRAIHLEDTEESMKEIADAGAFDFLKMKNPLGNIEQ